MENEILYTFSTGFTTYHANHVLIEVEVKAEDEKNNSIATVAYGTVYLFDRKLNNDFYSVAQSINASVADMMKWFYANSNYNLSLPLTSKAVKSVALVNCIGVNLGGIENLQHSGPYLVDKLLRDINEYVFTTYDAEVIVMKANPFEENTASDKVEQALIDSFDNLGYEGYEKDIYALDQQCFEMLRFLSSQNRQEIEGQLVLSTVEEEIGLPISTFMTSSNELLSAYISTSNQLVLNKVEDEEDHQVILSEQEVMKERMEIKNHLAGTHDTYEMEGYRHFALEEMYWLLSVMTTYVNRVESDLTNKE